MNQPGETLILGVGNLLCTDEGVGIHVIERLQAEYLIPDGVQVVDGGTLGLDLLYYLEGVRNLLLIDAVEMDGAPGATLRLADAAVPAFLSAKMSPHQMGVPDMLIAAKLRDLYPDRIVLWGVQPASLDIGLELSPPVAAQMDFLIAQVCNELAAWGITLTPRTEAVASPFC